MTNQQFLTNFYLQWDKVATASNLGYQPEEISLIASEAQELLVLSDYTSLSNAAKESFEETEKRTQELGELVKTAIINPDPVSIDNLTNGRFFPLPNSLATNPNDYSNVHWLTIYEEAITDDKCDTNKLVLAKTHDEINRLQDDPFTKPNGLYTWRVRVNNFKHELITDGTYKVLKYKMRYIRKPQPIDLTTNPNNPVSELSDIIHRRLLRLTVQLASKSAEDYDKYKTEFETNNSYRE